MTIDPEKVSISSSTPFAFIDHESAIPSEQEILFSMHTVFRTENIQQMKDEKRIFEVQLTLTDDNDPQLRPPPPSKNRPFRKKHQNRVFIIERCSKVSSFRIYITF